ncbi:MAG: acyl-CoA dehydrogenase family protein [Pseudomonadales bacterium]
MDTGFTDDQLQFRDVVARFLGDKSPPAAVREQMESARGYDTTVWAQLSGELGLAGTHFPEACGGHGFGAVELGIIAQEMGRTLYCGPFFSSCVMAGSAIMNVASAQQQERLLPELAAGSRLATLVLGDVSTTDRVGQTIGADNERLRGTAALVVDAHIADVFIVAAQAAGAVSFYEVAASDVQVAPQQSLDPTRKLSTVTLDNAPAQRLGDSGDARIDLLWDQLSTALAHEMIGGAEHLFESTIDYMKLRVQFGRAIGSFQALKHRCADLLLELELAKAMTFEAARYLATGKGDAAAPSMAKSLASDAYLSIARQAIQLRGGIGFTWEEDTHLWFKRAKSSEVFLGTPSWHRERVIARMENSNV